MRMRFKSILLVSSVLFMSACHNDDKTGVSAASSDNQEQVSSVTPMVSPVAPQPTTFLPPSDGTNATFTCTSTSSKDWLNIFVTDIEPVGDHGGPQGNYTITSNDKSNGLKGTVVIEGTDYHFSDNTITATSTNDDGSQYLLTIIGAQYHCDLHD